MSDFAKLDHKYVWHPFTQMQDWMQQEPVVIASGEGATLKDTKGRTYLDANSSIWTNLHGHNHPYLNKAISDQLSKIAHSSYLGLANEPASLLAEKLVKFTGLPKVFYSDDGSTAVETAIKLSHAFTLRSGQAKKSHFLSMENGYHGDTVGAVSVGQSKFFHREFRPLLFKTTRTPAPYCYRCPHNKAHPERADARDYRICKFECLEKLEITFRKHKSSRPITAFAFEPLIQGAAGMIAQPKGWLQGAAKIARSYGAQLIADEVMTGFDRTGSMFACEQEKVTPDFMCLAKGMTGGYLPMAATLTTQKVFDAFLGRYDEFKTFFHGHSYTGNQLGAAASLANLELLVKTGAEKSRANLAAHFTTALKELWKLSVVGDIRQVGLIAGIELVKDWKTKEPFPLAEQAGIRVCREMAKRGVLTRPVGNVIVLMPPYCTKPTELTRITQCLADSTTLVLKK